MESKIKKPKHLCQKNMSDVRLLRIGSHDATIASLSDDGAAFEINLGNVMAQVGENVQGFSIESVGFYNLMPLINEGSHDTFFISVENFNGGIPLQITLTPGNYTPETLAAELNTQISVVNQVNLVVTINPLTNRFVWTAGVPGSNFTIYSEGVEPDNLDPNAITRSGNAVLPILGFPPSQSSWTSEGGVLTSPAHWDCGGQRVAYVHSSYLLHDRSSVDGEGFQMAAIVSCPINVTYGQFNTVYPNQYQVQSTSWQRNHQIRAINIRLRTIRGTLFNLQGTEWYVTLKLWIQDLR